MKRLAIIATHPIQYHAPWFKALAAREHLEIKVFFAALPGPAQQGAGFGMAFEWDIPLLEGYSWDVLPNWNPQPRIDGFFGSIVRAARRMMKIYQPDVVLLTGWQQAPLLQTLFVARRLGIATLVRGESNGMKPRSIVARVVHKRLLPLYDAYLVIGEANRRFYANCGIGEERCFPCPYFVDNERFIRQSEYWRAQRPHLRRRWSIPENAFCFLYVGKLVDKKRIFDQLMALDRLQECNLSGPVHLLVVGRGILEPQIKQYVGQRRLPVSFAGFLNQSEISQAYAAADCIVLSSDYDETWGLVVNEAMASGLPAVISDRAGCGPDLLRSGQTGWCYPFGDVDALTNRMRDMAASPSTARLMGAAARSHVSNNYSVEKGVEGVMQAIEYLSQAHNRVGG